MDVANKYGIHFYDLGEKTKKPVALNRAIREIASDWYFILDADAIPRPHWAENMIAKFELGYQIFSGSVDISKGNTWMKVYNISLFHEFLTDKPAGVRKHLPALNLGFTRAFYGRNGPFCEAIDRSEDYEWTLRAFKNHEKLFFSPDIIVRHFPVNKDSFQSVFRYWMDSGHDGWMVRKKYKDILKTPFFMKWPWFVLIAAPILGLFPTLRILRSAPNLFLKNLHLIPLIYLTKVAWCIGVYSGSRGQKINSGEMLMPGTSRIPDNRCGEIRHNFFA